MTQYKKTILVDFDGVLHSYTSGWKGIEAIPDPPVPGALEFLQVLIRDPELDVCIYSSRSENENGRSAMRSWLLQNGLEIRDLNKIRFPERKPGAFLTIDDRAFCFKGVFPSLEEIHSFQPWWRK